MRTCPPSRISASACSRTRTSNLAASGSSTLRRSERVPAYLSHAPRSRSASSSHGSWVGRDSRISRSASTVIVVRIPGPLGVLHALHVGMLRLTREIGPVQGQQAVHLLPQPLQFVLTPSKSLVLHRQELQGGGHRADGNVRVGAAVHQMQEPQPDEILDGPGGCRLGDAKISYTPLDVDVLAP